jgi:hypothetical protein
MDGEDADPADPMDGAEDPMDNNPGMEESADCDPFTDPGCSLPDPGSGESTACDPFTDPGCDLPDNTDDDMMDNGPMTTTETTYRYNVNSGLCESLEVTKLPNGNAIDETLLGVVGNNECC